ncbi:MAG: hypothetical protein COB99_03270, partial [Sulfurimonas sp.]
MELVYLWVEDYKNIKKQGFNFSPKFECNFDEETNELTVDENKDTFENFFGNNINITAIVGENGSGKSSLLTYLCMMTGEVSINVFSCIFKENTIEIQIYNDCCKKFNVINNSNYTISTTSYQKDENYKNPKSHIFNDSEFIYYSNSHLELNSVFEFKNNFNFIGFLDKEHTFNLNQYHNKLNENLIYLFTQHPEFAKSTFDKFKIAYPKDILAIPSSLLSKKADDTTITGDFLHLPLIEVLNKLFENRWNIIINDTQYDEKAEKQKIKSFIKKLHNIYFRNRQNINKDFLLTQFLIQDIFKYFEKHKKRPIGEDFHSLLVKIIIEE